MTQVPRATRRQVQQRAGGRCEYCRIPEDIRPYPFHVEHIRSIKQGGTSDLDNLAWSCLYCNLRKGTDVAAYDETDTLVALYNPRTQGWDEHFEMVEALIEGTTAIGRATVKLLQLNDPQQVEARTALMEAGLW
jgi:hypothetical protein